MSKITAFNSKAKIQEQASFWVSRMDRGLSAQEKHSLVAWMNQSKAHYQALLSMASLWDDLSVLNELNGLFPLENNNTVKVKNSIIKYALAASLLLATITGTSLLLDVNPLFLNSNQQQWVHQTQFETPVGKQTTYSLPDGSSLILNTNSLVNVDYSQNHRQLTLLRGEARFDVAKDKLRPFTVTAGEQSFTALGTIFNIQKNNEQDIELVVTEGKVLITKISETINKITNSPNKLSSNDLPGIIVQSGEKAIIAHNNTVPVNKVSLDQVQRDLAWQQGMLIFNGEPLEQALKEVSRYTNVHFEIEDNSLKSLKVAGYFKAGDITGLLQSLNYNFNIEHEKISDNSIRLLQSRGTFKYN